MVGPMCEPQASDDLELGWPVTEFPVTLDPSHCHGLSCDTCEEQSSQECLLTDRLSSWPPAAQQGALGPVPKHIGTFFFC